MSKAAQAELFERILIAGSGGQGIILLGRLMANAALNRTPHLTFFPNYGAEVRGGTSYCQVILSSREIASPVASRFESMIIMDQSSADKFLPSLERGGLAVVNRSLCSSAPAPNILLVPATEEANRLGDTRVANLIMLGALIARRPCLPAAEIEDGIRRMLNRKHPELIALNIKAFETGLKL